MYDKIIAKDNLQLVACARLCIYEKFTGVKIYRMNIIRRNVSDMQSEAYVLIFRR